jgi:hypothetical protein
MTHTTVIADRCLGAARSRSTTSKAMRLAMDTAILGTLVTMQAANMGYPAAAAVTSVVVAVTLVAVDILASILT